jgi:hypothetical protein
MDLLPAHTVDSADTFRRERFSSTFDRFANSRRASGFKHAAYEFAAEVFSSAALRLTQSATFSLSTILMFCIMNTLMSLLADGNFYALNPRIYVNIGRQLGRDMGFRRNRVAYRSLRICRP